MQNNIISFIIVIQEASTNSHVHYDWVGLVFSATLLYSSLTNPPAVLISSALDHDHVELSVLCVVNGNHNLLFFGARLFSLLMLFSVLAPPSIYEKCTWLSRIGLSRCLHENATTTE